MIAGQDGRVFRLDGVDVRLRKGVTPSNWSFEEKNEGVAPSPTRYFLQVRRRELVPLVVVGEPHFEWLLAKEHRAHVHQIIERHELPVAHQTRRTGRPYTLVLAKRETLFAREAARRKQWLRDLEWVKRALS